MTDLDIMSATMQQTMNHDTSLEWLNQHLHDEGNKQFDPDQ